MLTDGISNSHEERLRPPAQLCPFFALIQRKFGRCSASLPSIKHKCSVLCCLPFIPGMGSPASSGGLSTEARGAIRLVFGVIVEQPPLDQNCFAYELGGNIETL